MAGRKKKTDKADTPADNVKPEDKVEATDAAEEVSEAPVEDVAEDTAGPGDDTPDDAPTDDTVETPEPLPSDVAPVVTDQSQPERQGAFFPMLLGGVAAAVVGFAVAKFVFPESWPASGNESQKIAEALDRNSGAIDALEGKVAALGDGPDAGGLETEIADQQAQIAALADRLAAAEDHLARLDARPVGEGLSGAALSTYEDQLSTLRAELDGQRQTIDKMNAAASANEATAATAAQDTLRRAALTRIQTALENGTGYVAALADLESTGVEIPAELSQSAAAGVASMTELLETYPDAARAALQAARSDSAEGGGFTGFLRAQLGARSLAPREGDDPDAILSRIEAAAKDGRLTDALAELEALPEAGRAHLTGWANRVSERLAAMGAMQHISDALN